jgi:hypothetical protein
LHLPPRERRAKPILARGAAVVHTYSASWNPHVGRVTSAGNRSTVLRVTIPTERTPVADALGMITSLVAERQALRSAGATDARIEANRLAVVYWLDRLSRALIAAHARQEGAS